MEATQQTPYPFGPLSLVQLAYGERSKVFRDRVRGPSELDPYDIAMVQMAYYGIYPTFGHIDCCHRRWYYDLWAGRKLPFGIFDVPERYRNGTPA